MGSFFNMRYFLLIVVFLSFPLTARATEAPSGQVVIDAHSVLRGRFVEEHQINQTQAPMQTSGHFVVAPDHGLIWGIEKPFPTLTIITPNGATQDVGGIALKLPTKNLHHIYDMVGGALAGDWKGLETEYNVKRDGAAHWQMLLTPRTQNKQTLPYATITVSGSRFVENIVMTKIDGASDSFEFSDEALSSAPLTAAENAAFAESKL
jgi:hypothetical protein